MSALRLHESGDCWWPCHYCQAEEANDDTTNDTEDDGDTND